MFSSDHYKERISSLITTGRKWPTVVSLSEKWEDMYGIYFHNHECCIINCGRDYDVEELYDDKCEVFDLIISKLESGDFKQNKNFQ